MPRSSVYSMELRRKSFLYVVMTNYVMKIISTSIGNAHLHEIQTVYVLIENHCFLSIYLCKKELLLVLKGITGDVPRKKFLSSQNRSVNIKSTYNFGPSWLM